MSDRETRTNYAAKIARLQLRIRDLEENLAAAKASVASAEECGREDANMRLERAALIVAGATTAVNHMRNEVSMKVVDWLSKRDLRLADAIRTLKEGHPSNPTP